MAAAAGGSGWRSGGQGSRAQAQELCGAGETGLLPGEMGHWDLEIMVAVAALVTHSSPRPLSSQAPCPSDEDSRTSLMYAAICKAPEHKDYREELITSSL